MIGISVDFFSLYLCKSHRDTINLVRGRGEFMNIIFLILDR